MFGWGARVVAPAGGRCRPPGPARGSRSDMAFTFCTIPGRGSYPPPLSSLVVILVDAALWPWRGRRWAHLVSDVSYDELHRFAARLGLARRSFQGDHYDVPAEVREEAIRLGATPVESRELLLRLRAAGLRLPPSSRRPPAVEAAAIETGAIGFGEGSFSGGSPARAEPAPSAPGSRTPPSP